MRIEECNPYLRIAGIQPAILEGTLPRRAYDHRLFFILDGEGELLLENEHTVSLAPDTLLFWDMSVAYHFRGKMRVAVLNFDLTRTAAARTEPICPPPLADFDPSLIFDNTTLEGLESPLIRPDSKDLREEILELVNAFAENDRVADAITSALLKKLLASLFDQAEEAQNAARRLSERVRRYIHLYAAEIRDNAAIARHFGYHPVYLASLFREQTGESLHHALLAERISLALKWLTRTDRSIEEIALDTGFSSRNHFCTVFKKFTGLSPLAYRSKKQMP